MAAPLPPRASRLGLALGRQARWCAQHPRWVALLLLLALLGSLAVAARTPLDLSFAGLMDRDHPEVQRYFAASRAHGLGGRLLLLIEASDHRGGGDEDLPPAAMLDEFVDALTEDLASDDRVASVRAPQPTTDTLAASPAWFVDDLAFARWQAWTQAPANAQRTAALRQALRRSTHRTQTEGTAPEARLLLVTLAVDSFEQGLDAQDFPGVDARVQDLATAHGVRARFAGMPAVVAQDEHATLGRIRFITPLSLLLALALLLTMERRPLGLLAVAFPMIVAASVTIATVGLWFGQITVMESLFGVLIFGLGVDVALHLGLRTRDASDARLELHDAIDVAFTTTGPGVVVGAVTTAGAFAALTFAPEPSFVRLGAAGALGVLVCLIAMLTGLPAAWALLGAGPRGSRHRHKGWLAALVAHTSRSATRRPIAHLLFAAVLVASAGAGLTQLRYENDLSRVVNREVEAVSTAETIAERFGVHPMPWVVVADDLGHARSLEEQLRELPSVGHTRSVARWFPASLTRRAQWLRDERPRLLALREQMPMAAQLVDPLLTASTEPIPSPRDLPRAERSGLLTDDGAPLVYAFAASAHMDAALAARERAEVREVAPTATSMVVLFELLLSAERPWMLPVVGGALGFVVLMLALDLRRPMRVVLALIPVLAASIFAFGLLGWLGISLNAITAMAAPLVLGLGVDDGIHVVHRLRDRPPDPDAIAETTAQVSHAIALTTATTCTSFSTLLLSGHPGLESMAWLMLLALPACLLASASTLPAMAMLLRRP